MDKDKHDLLLVATCVLSTLSFFLIFGMICCIYVYNGKIKVLKTENENLTKTIEVMSAYNRGVYSEMDDADIIGQMRASSTIEEYAVNTVEYGRSVGEFFARNACIVTSSGEKYHMLHCQHIYKAKEYKILDINTAILYGYKPCLDCH